MLKEMFSSENAEFPFHYKKKKKEQDLNKMGRDFFIQSLFPYRIEDFIFFKHHLLRCIFSC